MGRFVLRRIGSALITLWLLATIVFVMVSIIPGNVGRRVLGAFALESDVAAYNAKLGTDDPLLQQYGRALKNLVTLNFGNSYQNDLPVRPQIFDALFDSGKLAVLGLLLSIPLGIAAGVFAARRHDRLSDRAIVTAGLATSAMPEFVPAAMLVSLFCVKWKLGKAFADPPDGTSVAGQIQYLWTPAVAMAIVYFGYIARMARAGVITSMASDYTRTATMKGMSKGQVMRRHILRNALAPTITVVSVQIGYLFGGIIGVERVFNYHGLGSIMLDAVGKKDIPMLQGAVLLVGVIYMLATLLADLLIAFLNPRVRLVTQ